MSGVLVTGVSRYVGAELARSLAAEAQCRRVIGVDLVEPRHQLGGAEFVRSDVGNPLLGRILRQAQIDTVVHLSVSENHAQTGSARACQKERNVIGTMQLLALCQAHDRLRRLVLKSTGAVYGSSARDPAVFSEASPPGEGVRAGHIRDAIEVEGYARSLARRRRDVAVCVLRMAHIVGPRVRSPFTDYLRASVWPVPFGFDARLQLLHPQDANRALVAASVGTLPGVVNIAGEGVITLRQAARLLRRPTVPVPTATGRLLGSLARRAGLPAMSNEQIDYLMWGRCLDITAMRTRLGVTPWWSSRDALTDFAAGLAQESLGPDGPDELGPNGPVDAAASDDDGDALLGDRAGHGLESDDPPARRP